MNFFHKRGEKVNAEFFMHLYKTLAVGKLYDMQLTALTLMEEANTQMYKTLKLTDIEQRLFQDTMLSRRLHKQLHVVNTRAWLQTVDTVWHGSAGTIRPLTAYRMFLYLTFRWLLNIAEDVDNREDIQVYGVCRKIFKDAIYDVILNTKGLAAIHEETFGTKIQIEDYEGYYKALERDAHFRFNKVFPADKVKSLFGKTIQQVQTDQTYAMDTPPFCVAAPNQRSVHALYTNWILSQVHVERQCRQRHLATFWLRNLSSNGEDIAHDVRCSRRLAAEPNEAQLPQLPGFWGTLLRENDLEPLKPPQFYQQENIYTIWACEVASQFNEGPGSAHYTNQSDYLHALLSFYGRVAALRDSPALGYAAETLTAALQISPLTVDSLTVFAALLEGVKRAGEVRVYWQPATQGKMPQFDHTFLKLVLQCPFSSAELRVEQDKLAGIMKKLEDPFAEPTCELQTHPIVRSDNLLGIKDAELWEYFAETPAKKFDYGTMYEYMRAIGLRVNNVEQDNGGLATFFQWPHVLLLERYRLDTYTAIMDKDKAQTMKATLLFPWYKQPTNEFYLDEMAYDAAQIQLKLDTVLDMLSTWSQLQVSRSGKKVNDQPGYNESTRRLTPNVTNGRVFRTVDGQIFWQAGIVNTPSKETVGRRKEILERSLMRQSWKHMLRLTCEDARSNFTRQPAEGEEAPRRPDFSTQGDLTSVWATSAHIQQGPGTRLLNTLMNMEYLPKDLEEKVNRLNSSMAALDEEMLFERRKAFFAIYLPMDSAEQIEVILEKLAKKATRQRDDAGAPTRQDNLTKYRELIDQLLVIPEFCPVEKFYKQMAGIIKEEAGDLDLTSTREVTRLLARREKELALPVPARIGQHILGSPEIPQYIVEQLNADKSRDFVSEELTKAILVLGVRLLELEVYQRTESGKWLTQIQSKDGALIGALVLDAVQRKAMLALNVMIKVLRSSITPIEYSKTLLNGV